MNYLLGGTSFRPHPLISLTGSVLGENQQVRAFQCRNIPSLNAFVENSIDSRDVRPHAAGCGHLSHLFSTPCVEFAQQFVIDAVHVEFAEERYEVSVERDDVILVDASPLTIFQCISKGFNREFSDRRETAGLDGKLML